MCQSEVTDILVIFCSIIIFCTAGGVGEGVLFELDTCSNVFLLLLGMMGGGGGGGSGCVNTEGLGPNLAPAIRRRKLPRLNISKVYCRCQKCTCC